MSEGTNIPLPNLAPSGGVEISFEDSADHLPFTDAQVDGFREQDRWLPVSMHLRRVEMFLCHAVRPEVPLQIANVARIMKASLPPSAKISKDAKECVQECVSEFISFIVSQRRHDYSSSGSPTYQTSEAAEKCLNEKRKTINGEDVLTSARTLGFDNYEGVLKIYLAKLREVG